ncbi:hypothetical protein ETB97_004549 [Aspergillus alliaceus]|uniref:Gal80p-like C-terminal domain-containing protein n=1 Tax=Petromyces alliaceus TaxID=209559 RepID=A0A8H6EB41_PETAA|nr:hypothetical protein ETB97_004549 [Aspergillus burnettii]
MDVSTQLLDRVMILSVLRQLFAGIYILESMCNFNTVDLVVCVVIVFSHYKLVKPAIERGGGDQNYNWLSISRWPCLLHIARFARRWEDWSSSSNAHYWQLYHRQDGERHTEGTKAQVTLTIYAGHTMDFVASLLGQPETVSAQLQTIWPYVDILDVHNIIDSHVKKAADDYASRHGVMNNNVKYTYILRGGDAFQEGDGLMWDIIGKEG